MAANTPNHLQLELHVPDFATVLDFYGKLGFAKVRHNNAENNTDYLVMARDGTIINFWPGNDSVFSQPYFKRFPKDTKRGYGVELVITVDDIDGYYDSVRKFANVVEPLSLRSWGLKDFRVEDPFGYYLRFTEKHNILDPNYAAARR
jgi:lactoylglutathione lyase